MTAGQCVHAGGWAASPVYQAFCRSELADPYQVLDALRSAEPVHWSPVLDAWLVTSYQEVTAGLRDPGLRSDRVSINARAVPGTLRPKYASLLSHVSNWLGFTDPPKHTQMREVARKVVNPAVAAKSRPMIEASAQEIVAGLHLRDNFDLVEELALRLPLTVVCRLLGVPDENVTDFHQLSLIHICCTGGTPVRSSPLRHLLLPVPSTWDQQRSGHRSAAPTSRGCWRRHPVPPYPLS